MNYNTGNRLSFIAPHYFSPMKKILFYTALLFGSCTENMKTESQTKIPENFNWQGHRGCRGLMPENSIDGFLHALEFPIQTLELDVVMSRDMEVIVSHEPWFTQEICICDTLKTNNIFQMSYDEIKAIDCGSKIHPRFKDQKKVNTYKPSLSEVVAAVKKNCVEHKRALPKFNIELKSQVEWDVIYTPSVGDFVDQVYLSICRLGIEDITTVQSFDTRILNRFMSMKTKLRIAYLTEDDSDPLVQLEQLNQLPHIYSPLYTTLNTKVVQDIKKLNLEVIPWTVNDTASMLNLIEMGVDGIITDYPNLIAMLKFNK